jgi:hypothetical protein
MHSLLEKAADRMPRPLQLLKNALINDRSFFVLVNVAVNLLFLIRSYVTMRTLE